MRTTSCFLDTEFTGLHQQTSLISLALVDQQGRAFYAEFTDYARDQADDWIRQNVLRHSRWLAADPPDSPLLVEERNTTLCCGPSHWIRARLEAWLEPYPRIEIWADCLAYDWVLFCQLFGGALNLPEKIFYMPFDLATLFKLRGLDPDTDRETFAALEPDGGPRHNALRDARVTRACHHRLITES